MTAVLLATLAELILVAFACAALLTGLSGSEPVRRLTVPVCLLGLAIAFFFTRAEPAWLASETYLLGGILHTGLAAFVQPLALVAAALVLLVLPIDSRRRGCGDVPAMLLFSAAGVMLTAASGDLITLFFALELTSLPTYAMVVLARRHAASHEAGVKYFFLGALSAALIVLGFGLIYGATGQVELLELPIACEQLHAGNVSGWWLLVSGLVISLLGLCFKLAAFPMHVYAGDVYCAAHPAVTAWLGFAPKAAGLFAMGLLFAAAGPVGPAGWTLPGALPVMIALIAVLSMTVGNLLALLQQDVQRMMGYSSVAHSGYMLLGLLAGPAALAAGQGSGLSAVLFYLTGYLFMNFGVLAVLCYVRRENHPEQTVRSLDELAGLCTRSPLATVCLCICAASLIGLPPAVGFWGKLSVFSTALQAPLSWAALLVIIALVNSAISATYYLRLVAACFRSPIHAVAPASDRFSLRFAVASAAALVLWFGLFPSRLAEPAAVAGELGTMFYGSASVSGSEPAALVTVRPD
mgnify:CR=1 FL=1